MSALLRAGIAACLLGCVVPAWADTKVLTFTAHVTDIYQNNEWVPPPPAYFQLGMVFTGRWTLQSGEPGGYSTVLSTETTIGNVHLRSDGGMAANSSGIFFSESGPYAMLSQVPSSAQWDYADPAWQPNFLSFNFRGAPLQGLPQHVLPDAAYLSGAQSGGAAFCAGEDSMPMYCYIGEITSFTLTDVSPVPEPDAPLLFLAGATLLLVRRRWHGRPSSR